MQSIYRNIFRAIHEGKWLSIEYRNKEDVVTKYWIGIQSLDIREKTLSVEGMHLGTLSVQAFSKIRMYTNKGGFLKNILN